MAALVVMQELAGWSAPLGFSEIPSPMSPVEGDYFQDGSQNINAVHALLQQAAPAGWQGMASSALDTATQVLLGHTQAMAENDLAMANLVNNHAACVSQTQFHLGMFQDALVPVLALVLWMERISEAFVQAAAWTIALEASLAFLGAGLGELVNCVTDSDEAKRAADDIDYASSTAAAQQIVAIYAAALRESTAAVAQVVETASAPAVPAEAASAAPAAPSAPEAVPSSQTLAAALGWTSGPVPQIGAASWTPQAAAPVRQPANIVGDAAPASNRVSPQAQRATTAPAVGPSDPSDPSDPGDPSDADQTAAGAATPSAERAPINVPAGPEPVMAAATAA